VIARAFGVPVNPKRLGAIGPEAFPDFAHAVTYGTMKSGSETIRLEQATIPLCVEAWAGKNTSGSTDLTVCINRTPATGDISAARDKREINAFGCGLADTITKARLDIEFNIWINVTTPYMPITSDGKAPDLVPFLGAICEVVNKVVHKTMRLNRGGERLSQKDIVLNNLDDAIAGVSGDNRYRFNQRQLLYALRPIVREEIGDELTAPNFAAIITDYEAEHGEIPGMYREPRGTLYHPHRAETINLGTLMVETYERPTWTFNKLVYIEKEGFSEALKDEKWAERHDCALLSSKGFTTRAARDLVDLLAEHDEPVTVFCVHDADAAGTMIFETFQEATKARGARKIRIINLGLEPWEAVALGLEVETVKVSDRQKPVASYVAEQTCEEEEGNRTKWLQTKRVELNAMSTPAFISWLDGKTAAYDKLIPLAAVLVAELDARIETKIRAAVTARILREANFERQVETARAAIQKPSPGVIADGIKGLFEQEADRSWRDQTVARDLVPDASEAEEDD
jgi:hypothetical protein